MYFYDATGWFIKKMKSMLDITPQYIKDTAGKKLVVLTAKQFKNIIEELEELEDIKRYDAAQKRKKKFKDADLVFKEIEAKRRKHV